MSDFDWRKHKDMLNEQDDHYSENVYTEYSEKAMKILTRMVKGELEHNDAIIQVRNLLKEYREFAESNPKIQIKPWSEIKGLIGNDQKAIEQAVHLYPASSINLYDNADLILFVIRFTPVIVPMVVKESDAQVIVEGFGDIEIDHHSVLDGIIHVETSKGSIQCDVGSWYTALIAKGAITVV